jgi:hypothetical protein
MRADDGETWFRRSSTTPELYFYIHHIPFMVFSLFGVTDYVFFLNSLDALNVGKKGET